MKPKISQVSRIAALTLVVTCTTPAWSQANTQTEKTATPQKLNAALQTTSTPVIGFGSNVPLKTALKQILPDNVTYTTGPGVIISKKVSWSGDGSWQTTARNTIKKAGYNVSICNNRIKITAAISKKLKRVLRQVRHMPVYHHPHYARISRPVIHPHQIYDSPTVYQMTPAEARAATPLPLGTAIAPGAVYPPTTNQTINQSTGTPYVPSYPIALVPDITPPPAWKPKADEIPTTADLGGFNPPAGYDTRIWHVQAGSTLLQTLQEWCNQKGGGWYVYPVTHVSYKLLGSINIEGTFQQAVTKLINDIHSSDPPYATINNGSTNVILTDAEHDSIAEGRN